MGKTNGRSKTKILGRKHIFPFAVLRQIFPHVSSLDARETTFRGRPNF